jgi:2-keto-3-deoxy-L-rhamnonate aldolase RhmA
MPEFTKEAVMDGKELRQKLHDGERVYGTLITGDSPRWPQAVTSIGLDFVFIDTEHLSLDRQKTSWMCQVYSALHLAPIVRIPSPDPFQAIMVLDGGAHGVIAPYIEDPSQVRTLVGAVKYRPLKGKLLHNLLENSYQPDPETRAYLDEYNSNNLLIVNIESLPALEILDEILSVGGLDAVLIGPHDLSISLGVPEQYTHPAFLQAVETIISKARYYSLGAGLHATYPNALEQELVYAKMGANLFVHQGDLISFRVALRYDLDALKLALGDHQKPGSEIPGEMPGGHI